MLQGIATMGRGRKKREVHPGQPCGPYHLCQHLSTHYCHIATWDEEEIREITAVSDRQCICRACEEDFKRNASRDGHRFGWMTARARLKQVHCSIMHREWPYRNSDERQNSWSFTRTSALCAQTPAHTIMCEPLQAGSPSYYMIICTQTKGVVYTCHALIHGINSMTLPKPHCC